MNIPSILNDVIGPVMRGPSSSHSAATVRIGAIARELMGGKLRRVEVRFDLNGSLPTTYISQGSDMGLCGGLLGFAADDERLAAYKSEMAEAGVEIGYENGNYGDQHPNTYNLSMQNDDEVHTLKAISIGGGIVEIVEIDGCPVSFFGDCYGLAIFGADEPAALRELLNNHGCRVAGSENQSSAPIFATRSKPFDDRLFTAIAEKSANALLRPVSPVLPILTPEKMNLPFTTCAEMEIYGAENGIGNLAELALVYESARGGTGRKEIIDKAEQLVELLEDSIEEGLEGTVSRDRILGVQSTRYDEQHRQGNLVDLGILDRVIVNVTSLMEVKSAMGIIVAAPTAGSCGGLPGAVLAVGDKLGFGRREKALGLLAAGIIGVLVATKSTFSAEVCGCQAECGVSSGMIAGAVTTMMGGDSRAAMAAASMALQNIFGMVCDPVANRVEVPCLGKNILAASNGISCANMALAGFDHVIPFDEVVVAMDSVGRSLPHELRCTALGGLSVTPTSKRLAGKLGI